MWSKTGILIRCAVLLKAWHPGAWSCGMTATEAVHALARGDVSLPV
jgi:hypothetical protein